MKFNSSKMKKAFTLIELSISMLILGLLISGVLVANKMQKSAKRNKIIKEKDQLEQAIIDFKVQYGALPGSMKMYNQIQDFPELGAKANYKTVSASQTLALANQFTDNVYFNESQMPANAMLQMKNSSGGAFPGISATSTTVINTRNNINFLKSNAVDAIWAYGYNISFSAVHGYGSTEDFRQLTIGTTPVSQLPSFITNFLGNHVIVMSGVGASGTNNTQLGFASISTSDAVALSKKYDNGKPYGEKISFGRGRNTTSGRCVTATTFVYGTTAATDIGPKTTFSTVSPDDAINGCAVMFMARFNEM
jgi:prepilin-type N-terminal cleavage/methylation domain-containing protein